MIATLSKALAEGRLEDKLKFYTVPRLLIIDEIEPPRHSRRAPGLSQAAMA
jgi:DNA replication protein DnaC